MRAPGVDSTAALVRYALYLGLVTRKPGLLALLHGSPYFSGAAPQYIFGPPSPYISELSPTVQCLYNPA